MGFDSGKSDIKKGQKHALNELSRIYEGPLKGLQMAPDFFKALQSPELAGTPLGRGVDLQNQLISEALGGLTGRPSNAGRLPADLQSSVLESFGGAQAARGTFGSPAADLGLANEFAGQSEAIRAQRLNQALAVLGGTSAAGSVFPSANAFLDVGRQRALTAADIQFRGGLAQGQADQQSSAALSSLIGTGLGLVSGGLLGGFGGLGGLTGYSGGQGFNFGAAAQGAGSFSGLIPQSAFAGGRNPFITGQPGSPDLGGLDLASILAGLKRLPMTDLFGLDQKTTS